jgi:hypothetical protein
MQVGLAEASVALFRLAHRQGDDQAAASHIQAAVGHYSEFGALFLGGCVISWMPGCSSIHATSTLHSQ